MGEKKGVGGHGGDCHSYSPTADRRVTENKSLEGRMMIVMPSIYSSSGRRFEPYCHLRSFAVLEDAALV